MTRDLISRPTEQLDCDLERTDEVAASKEQPDVAFKELLSDFRMRVDMLRDYEQQVQTHLTDTGALPKEQRQLIDYLYHHLDPENVKMDRAASREWSGKLSITNIAFDPKAGYNVTIGCQDDDAREKLTKALWTLGRKRGLVELLCESALVMLVTIAESFLYRVFHAYYDRYPYPEGHAEKAFSLDDLRNFGSVEDAREYLLDQRIDAIMRGGFEFWVSALKKRQTLNLQMTCIECHRGVLSEVFQRRHLLVHNGGVVNEYYLRNVEEAQRADLALGKKVVISREYLAQAIDTVEACFMLIGVELWQKLGSLDTGYLTEVLLECLSVEKFVLAEGLALFLRDAADKGAERDRLIAELNYWQTMRWKGDYEKVRSEVESTDYSAKSPVFRLGYSAVTGRADEFFVLLPEVLRSADLSPEDARAWPIFRVMREDPRFEEILQRHVASEVPSTGQRQG